MVGSQVFTGCQSCRWLLSHIATTIPGRRVFFNWYTREYKSFKLPFDLVVVFRAHASALEKGSLKGIMFMIRHFATCKVIKPPFFHGHVIMTVYPLLYYMCI